MPFIKYQNLRIQNEKLRIVNMVNAIVKEFNDKGYALSLRQIYYVFVSRDLFAADWADPKTGSTNNEKSYKKLGKIISDGRMAGLIDWTAIEDRTRNMDGNQHWDDPVHILRAVSQTYQIDKWQNQDYRPEVWVEKDALEGVVGVPCRRLDVPFFSCRGYTSQTAMWDNATRMLEQAKLGVNTVVLHLGDHDPSGIDMSRDIEDRIRLFMGTFEDHLIFKRIALHIEQVRKYNPPENPAKPTDSRFERYAEKFGESSWELDALDPGILDKLISDNILAYRDEDEYSKMKGLEDEQKRGLTKVYTNWTAVQKFLEKKK
jgi:hypothetical protein